MYCLLHLKACASDLPGYKVVQANHWYGTQRFNITKNLIRIDNSYGHMLLSTNDELVTIYNDKTKKIAFLKPVELADSVFGRDKIEDKNLRSYMFVKKQVEHGFNVYKYERDTVNKGITLVSYIYTLPDIEISKPLTATLKAILNYTIPYFPSKEITFYKTSNGLMTKPFIHYYTSDIAKVKFTDNTFKPPKDYTKVNSLAAILWDEK